MTAKRRKLTTDGLAILDRELFNTPYARRRVEEAVLNARIAQDIYALRTRAGLTQKQLAKLVGTTDSVISRLEDADYKGHSLKILQRICSALDQRLEVHFVPVRKRRKTA